jgi:hypothetical protein
VRCLWRALFLGAGLLLPTLAEATPSFLGPVGPVLTPSADTLGRSRYAFTLHHQPHWNLLGASYSPLESLEVGVTFVDPTSPGEYQTHAGVNMKVRLLREQETLPAVSLGVIDAFATLAEGPYTRSYYGVVSKHFRVNGLYQPLQVSAGGGNGILKRGFFAVAAPVHPMGTAILEYDGTHFNPCARLFLPRGFVLDVAAVDGQFGVGAAFRAEW